MVLPLAAVAKCSVPRNCESRDRAVRAMSKTAFQQVGLSVLPCPVPRSQAKGCTAVFGYTMGCLVVEGGIENVLTDM